MASGLAPLAAAHHIHHIRCPGRSLVQVATAQQIRPRSHHHVVAGAYDPVRASQARCSRSAPRRDSVDEIRGKRSGTAATTPGTTPQCILIPKNMALCEVVSLGTFIAIGIRKPAARCCAPRNRVCVTLYAAIPFVSTDSFRQMTLRRCCDVADRF
jgi:hypothetical protein